MSKNKLISVKVKPLIETTVPVVKSGGAVAVTPSNVAAKHSEMGKQNILMPSGGWFQ